MQAKQMKNYIAESRPVYNAKASISSASDIADELKEMQGLNKEHFVAVYLDSSNRVLKKETISIGTLNQSMVHPREVYAPAFKTDGIASIIVAHNHPSGVCEPSREDIVVTKRLHEAGKILGIELLDHIIIVKDGFVSLKDLEHL